MLGDDLSSFLDNSEPFDSIEARDNVIGRFLVAAINQEYSLDDSRELFRNAGMTFSNQRFEELYNVVSEMNRDATRVKFVNRDSTPSESILAASPYDMPENYRFIVTYDYYDDIDDKLKTSGVTVDLSFLPTRGEIEQFASEILSGSDPTKVDTADNFRLREGYKKVT